MSSFETPQEEIHDEEIAVDHESIETNNEVISPIEALKKENSWKKILKGKGLGMLSAFMVGTAALIPSESSAENAKPEQGAAEMTQVVETANTSVFSHIVSDLMDAKGVKTAEQADALIADAAGKFSSEFSTPTEGDTQEVYGVNIRKSGAGDEAAITGYAHNLLVLMNELNSKFSKGENLPSFDGWKHRVEGIITTLENSKQEVHEKTDEEKHQDTLRAKLAKYVNEHPR